MTNNQQEYAKSVCLGCHREIYGKLGEEGICKCGMRFVIVPGEVADDEEDDQIHEVYYWEW